MPTKCVIAEVEWRVIPSFPHIEVSNAGQFRTQGRWVACKNGLGYCGHRFVKARVLRTFPSKGYLNAVVSCYGVRATLFVHRSVAEAFIGPNPGGLHVLHKDDNKLNNTPSNLYYGTHQQNMLDRNLTGWNPARGDRHGRYVHGGRVGERKCQFV